MANADSEPSGLIARTAVLLNNPMFSDVEFHVEDESGRIKQFYAHKLILAMAGKGFQALYAASDSPKPITVSDSSPHAFHLMLAYLYTDVLTLLSMEEAVNVFKLARRYSIKDLEKACTKYIIKDEVKIDNLFDKYECALACNFQELLLKCRMLVQSETKAVFASKYFGDASFSVIQDILGQSCLNVSSELDVISAALKWSECECKRKGRPTEKFRDAMEPLLKHLRFLSLSADEFCLFLEKSSILTGFEGSLIMRKILQPQSDATMPKYLSSITSPRQPYTHSSVNNSDNRSSGIDAVGNKTVDISSYDYRSSGNSSFNNRTSGINSFDNKNTNSSSSGILISNKNIEVGNFDYRNSGNSKINKTSGVSTSDIKGAGSANFHNRDNFNDNYAEKSINFMKSEQFDPLFFRQKSESPQLLSTKADGASIFQFNPVKLSPVLKVMPQTVSVKRTFDFPLVELQKGIAFAFLNDIKCSAEIRMRRGTILVFGIELKITGQKSNPNESIEVLTCVSGNFPSKVESYSLKLKNSVIALQFPEPIRVSPSDPVEIEITIEDLHLNRCYVCQDQVYELNCGLNYMAEISVKSNQTTESDNFLFLISRIIYST